MGITGLLPLLKSITRDTHVRQLQGQRVAVDTYCWLHKGALRQAGRFAWVSPPDRFVSHGPLALRVSVDVFFLPALSSFPPLLRQHPEALH